MDVVAGGLGFVEGPVWHDDRLWFTVVDDATVAYVGDGGAVVAYGTGGGPNGLAAGPGGALYVANNGGAVHGARGERRPGLQRLGRGGEVELLVSAAVDLDGDEVPLRAPNDLAVAPDGAMWFTDPANSPVPPLEHPGLVCRFAVGDERAAVGHAGLQYPNGIAFHPDGARLFVAESFTGRVVTFGWRTGAVDLGEPERFCRIDGGVPDGICFDTEGRLYAASTFAGNVQVFDLDGRLVEKLEVGEGSFLTNCCFGGPGLSTLYATDAATMDPRPHEHRHRQRIVAFDLGVKGHPLPTGD
jgi:gluconolactonase